MSMGAVGRKRAEVSGKCSRRRCHSGKRGTCWVEVGGWVDILKSGSTGWIACWLGFGMTSENSSIKRVEIIELGVLGMKMVQVWLSPQEGTPS